MFIANNPYARSGLNLYVERSFSTKSESNVSITVTSVTKLTTKTLLENKVLPTGNYEYSCSVPSSGTYLIQYKYNGNINIKKIFVE